MWFYLLGPILLQIVIAHCHQSALLFVGVTPAVIFDEGLRRGELADCRIKPCPSILSRSQVGKVEPWIGRLPDRLGQHRQPEAPHHLLGAIAATNAAARMPGESIVHVLAYARRSQCVLEPMAERMEHAGAVRNPKTADVPPEPFRPRLAQAPLGPWCQKRKNARFAPTALPDLLYTPQEPDPH